MKRLLALTSLAGPAVTPAQDADDGLVLGILESLAPARQQSLERDYGMPTRAVICLAFRKTEAGWQAFDNEAAASAQLKARIPTFSAGARLDGCL